MSDSQVVYDLRLKDGLTGGVNTANSAVNRLESSLGSVKGLLTGIGIGLAAFKLGEFVHSANEEWEKMEFSMSQVEAALKSTQGAAGLTFGELKTGAEEAAHNIKFTQAEILGMQSILLTFPSITKQTFGEASTIIEDMSTRLGQDLKSSAVQLGKALQDPERGITALRRVGVNFNDEQEKTIKHLAETNQLAKAQALILNELSVEFGGSAAAAAEADKSFRLDKTMEENKVALGKVVDELKEKLQPMLISVANKIRDFIGWVDRNSDSLISWGKSIAAAVIAFKTMSIIPPLLLTIENGMVAAAASGAGFTTMISAALGPTLLLAAAVGGLVLAIQKYRSYADVKDTYLAAVAKDETDFVQQGMEKYKGKKDAYELALKDEESALATSQQNITASLNKELSIRDGLRKKAHGNVQSLDYDEKQALSTASENVANLQNDILKISTRQSALASIKKTGLVPETKAGTPATGAGAAASLKEPKTKATGSKSVTINVTIKELIHEYSNNITNVKEIGSKIKEHVVAALTGAVNDFQIVAGNS